MSLLFMGASFLLAWCYARSGSRIWRIPPINLLAGAGRCSYSIYVWGTTVFQFFYYGHYPLIGIVLALGMGMLATVAIEKPFLNLRERIEYHRKTVSTSRPTALRDTTRVLKDVDPVRAATLFDS